MNIHIVQANLTDAAHQAAIVAMMDAYANDPMGDGKPLSDYARQNLIAGLTNHPTTLVFLVMESSVPRGIATCFRGLSTFAAKPLINLSDFYVEPLLRGKGIGRKLLAAIEDEAKRIGCHSGNDPLATAVESLSNDRYSPSRGSSPRRTVRKI